MLELNDFIKIFVTAILALYCNSLIQRNKSQSKRAAFILSTYNFLYELILFDKEFLEKRIDLVDNNIPLEQNYIYSLSGVQIDIHNFSDIFAASPRLAKIFLKYCNFREQLVTFASNEENLNNSINLHRYAWTCCQFEYELYKSKDEIFSQANWNRFLLYRIFKSCAELSWLQLILKLLQVIILFYLLACLFAK